jgi:hypothetical protein
LVQPYVRTEGQSAVDLFNLAGGNLPVPQRLEPWQAQTLTDTLGEREDGTWAARNVCLVVARQNGKGTTLEARALAELFIIGGRKIVWSAHQNATAMEAFGRMRDLIMGTPALANRLAVNGGISMNHGAAGVGFKLKNGAELRFKTRTKSGLRGFSGDLLIIDEAMFLTDEQNASLAPVISAKPLAQIWYVGSAVDQETHTDAWTFTRMRMAGMRGDEPRLDYFEWSAPGTLNDHDPLDRHGWALANPGLGLGRLTEENVESERSIGMGSRQFAVERLGIGDWPVAVDDGRVIPAAAWKRQVADLKEPGAQFTGPVAFAVEAKPDLSWTSICAARRRVDGFPCVEVIARAEGTAWVADAVARLVKKWDPVAVALDFGSPSNAMRLDIEAKGIELFAPPVRQITEACGSFLVGVTEGQLFHTDEPLLNDAVRVVQTRQLSSGIAWDRYNANADIAPLFGATLAAFALAVNGTPAKPPADPVLADAGPDAGLGDFDWENAF